MGGLHVALIMDGNGRWAGARGLPRSAGHRAGAHAVRRVVEAAPGCGIHTLTLYAFSSDNWKRPAAEVRELMELFERYLRRERRRLIDERVRLSVIGRRDRLTPRLVAAIESTERATAACDGLTLRLAVDYSSRRAIAETAGRLPRERVLDADEFLRELNRTIHSPPEVPAVDLVIRTSGERRLSDFLLWESAYAELVFVDRLWPEMDGAELGAAVQAFHRRERRFGGVAELAVPSAAGE